jgi:hypothetical protein
MFHNSLIPHISNICYSAARNAVPDLACSAGRTRESACEQFMPWHPAPRVARPWCCIAFLRLRMTAFGISIIGKSVFEDPSVSPKMLPLKILLVKPLKRKIPDVLRIFPPPQTRLLALTTLATNVIEN